VSVTPKLQVEPNRIIEINKLGKFYVMGKPEFHVLYVPDLVSPERTGYIIIDDTFTGAAGENVQAANKLMKMTEDRKLIPALFKSREMAEEVCFACNRIRV
jgi:hypothetical protein